MPQLNFGAWLLRIAIAQGLEGGSDEVNAGDCYCGTAYDNEDNPIPYDIDRYREEDLNDPDSELMEDIATNVDIRCGVCRHGAVLDIADTIFTLWVKPQVPAYTVILQYADGSGETYMGTVNPEEECLDCAVNWAREDMCDDEATVIAVIRGSHTDMWDHYADAQHKEQCKVVQGEFL